MQVPQFLHFLFHKYLTPAHSLICPYRNGLEASADGAVNAELSAPVQYHWDSSLGAAMLMSYIVTVTHRCLSPSASAMFSFSSFPKALHKEGA